MTESVRGSFFGQHAFGADSSRDLADVSRKPWQTPRVIVGELQADTENNASGGADSNSPS